MIHIRLSAAKFVAFVAVVVTSVACAADPQPPQASVDTTYVAPTGRVISVPAGGSLQAAIDSAVYGDVIEVAQGATFTGNFALRQKSGSGWITIRTSAPDGTFPAPGTRVQSALHASMMPKIVTAKDVAAIYTEGTAHHYRLIGLEITTSYNTSYGLVTLGTGSETSASALPSSIIIDRCYIHGNATANIQNGVRLNSASSAIIESQIDECHSLVSESHCIGGVNGPGPYKISNNYLSGATINVLFGGAVPSISGNIPSDIEFKRNFCTRPTNWRPSAPDYIGINWGVKNLFELKNAQRVWIEGNTFEHNWPHEGTLPDGAPQHGFAMLFTVRDESGAVPWAVDQDITCINNIIRQSNCGISFYGSEGQGTKRIKVENNLFDDIGLNWGNNDRSGMYISPATSSDIQFNHNTIINDGDIAFCTGAAPNTGLVFKNNIVNHNASRTLNTNYGFNGAGTNFGYATFNFFFPSSYTYSRNAMMSPTAYTSNYPADNYFPASWTAVGFTDFANRNYRLASTSPYKGQGTDGKDLGCDIDAINTAINGGPGPDTTPPTISAVAASSITTSGATITWTTNESSTTQVEYGTTTAYGSSSTPVTTLVTSHTQALTGLAAGTTYNYRVKSTDAAGNLATLGNFTFTTATPPDTTPPTISAVAASSITTSGATITWTTNESSTTQVEYGTTTAYGSSTTLVTTLVTSHSQALTGLAASTTYNYRVKSKDAAGNLATSGNFTFTTAAQPDTTPPTISAVAASSITISGATITWTTNESSTTQVEYGTTTAYGSSTTLLTTLVTSHSQALTGLAASTTYNYRVKSKDAAGNLATSGNFTFTTAAQPDTTPPTISAVGASSITTSGATITWTTNEASNTQVEYGTTTAYGSSTTLDATLVTSHSQALTGLATGTTYNYRVKSKDAAGNLATSGNFTFTTASAPPPPPPPPAPLAVSSGPTATPNPAKAGQTVQFSVAATGGNAPLTFSWSFGDGGSGSGATPTHVYAAAGTYSVQVTVSDAAGQSVSATMSITIQRSKPRKSATITAAAGALSYTTTSRDQIAIAGTLPDTFEPAGTAVSVDVDGSTADFTLDKRGRAKSGTSTFVYSAKTNSFKVILKNQSVSTAWAAAGRIDMSAASGTLALDVVLTINGEEYEGAVDATMTARPGKSGKFRK